MTRHARNCTAGAVYTYHEKKKDARSSGYGTESQRIGKDSVKDFDCCCLTLQPCKDPVVTYVIYSVASIFYLKFDIILMRLLTDMMVSCTIKKQY